MVDTKEDQASSDTTLPEKGAGSAGSDERFRALFDTSPIGMAVTSLDGRIARVNEAFSRFLLRKETELTGRRFHELVTSEDRAGAEHLIHRPESAESAEVSHLKGVEWRFLRSDGEIVWGSVSASWLTVSGEPHSRVFLLQDTTSRKKMEMAMLRQEKLEAVGRLAGGIAHDFNNSLTTILGNVNLAVEVPGVADEVRERLAVAERAIRRAQHLTNQLITFARGGQPVMEMASLATIATDSAGLCLSGGTTCAEIYAAPDLWRTEVDSGQIAQVFQNLYLNAAEASGPGATVEVRLYNEPISEAGHPVLPAGRYVRASVIDRGEGIPADRRAQVFDPYYSTRGRGGGMGLAIVQSIIRQHGGAVEFESEVGHGSSFHFWVPACIESKRVHTHATKPAAETADRWANARVLVMDDDPDLLDLERHVMARAGYRVVTSRSGEEAIEAFDLAQAEGRPFDLVVLDLTVVGGMGGVEALQKMQASDPDVLAIVSSGYSDDPVMSNYIRHGFAACLPKPFSTKQLAEIIERTLG